MSIPVGPNIYCDSKSGTHTKFLNDQQILANIIIFVDKIYKEICSMRVLIKQGTILGYFHSSHLEQTALIVEMDLFQSDRISIKIYV